MKKIIVLGLIAVGLASSLRIASNGDEKPYRNVSDIVERMTHVRDEMWKGWK